MTTWLLLGFVLVQHPAAEPPTGNVTAPSVGEEARSTAGVVALASQAGAALNSTLLHGGGTDDTAVLQAVLDRAADGTPVQLVVDGVALVSGLNVYGNTTIECLDGGGLYLKDGSSRAIIRNAHRSKEAITDERITIRGCFLNGNRDHQPSADIPRPDLPGICCTPSNREADGTHITGLQFLGVNDLTIENMTLWNIRAFGALIANANRIAVKNLTVDIGLPDVPNIVANTDGLMLKGPLRYLTVDGLKVRTGDVALAFNADVWPEEKGNLYGPYVGVGPITDVTVNNVQFMDTQLGIGFISAKERIDRVTISNVTGTVRGGAVASLTRWVNPSGPGNFGSIMFDNVNVDRSNLDAATIARQKAAAVERLESYGELGKALLKNMNDGVAPYFKIHGHIENLSVRNIMTKVSDDRPILWFSPDASVQMLTAELTLLDPMLQAVPLELAEGSRIERLEFSLRWNGNVSDQGKNPIVSLGGTVGQLHWVNTPPMYVGAEVSDGNTVVVTFSQAVKAMDFTAGMDIKVNSEPVGIARARHKPGHAEVVQYVLNARVRRGDSVTWAYDAAVGHIQNWSGGQLLSVSEKAVTNR